LKTGLFSIYGFLWSPGGALERPDCHECLSDDLYLTLFIGDAELKACEPFTVFFNLFNDASCAGKTLAKVCNRHEPGPEPPKRLLRHPVGKKSSQISHRQHAMGEYIFHPGLARVIEIDVDWIVIAGCPREKSERKPRNWDRGEGRNLASGAGVFASGIWQEFFSLAVAYDQYGLLLGH
jgi:hypothetical protein